MRRIPAPLLSSVYVTMVLKKNAYKPLAYLAVHQTQGDATRNVRNHVPNFRFMPGLRDGNVHECDRFIVTIRERVVLD